MLVFFSLPRQIPFGRSSSDEFLAILHGGSLSDSGKKEGRKKKGAKRFHLPILAIRAKFLCMNCGSWKNLQSVILSQQPSFQYLHSGCPALTTSSLLPATATRASAWMEGDCPRRVIRLLPRAEPRDAEGDGAKYCCCCGGGGGGGGGNMAAMGPRAPNGGSDGCSGNANVSDHAG